MTNSESEYVCKDCGKTYPDHENGKWSAWVRCACGAEAYLRDYVKPRPVKNRNNGTNWQ